MSQTLPKLPWNIPIESKRVLRRLTSAHRALAELKGFVKTIPKETLLLHTLSLQEAKDSSAIENIITTHYDLYREDVYPDRMGDLAAKEVKRYSSALLLGYERVKKEGLLRTATICEIQSELEKNRAGFRSVPGTVLKNSWGETVYTPPQHPDEIISLMSNLEAYINDNELEDSDPLIKMAIIHYQFESIHPFYDGNGRTGRIINVLYLVLNNLLDLPVLYASRFIVQNKSEYYRLLQGVRENNLLEDWILYMLAGIEQTAVQTMKVVIAIVNLMNEMSEVLKQRYSFYSKELVECLFIHPYTKIEFIQNVLGISRVTAMRYLNTMVNDKILEKHSIGKAHYFVNTRLYNLLQDIPPLTEQD